MDHHGSFKLALSQVVPSFFFGMLIIVGLAENFRARLAVFSPNDPVPYVLMGSVTAVITILAAYLCFRLLDPRLSSDRIVSAGTVARRKRLTVTLITAGACGASTALLLVSRLGILILTAILLLVILTHIRRFGRTIGRILRPGALPSVGDAWRFIEIYMNVLIGFTLLNASLDLLHHYSVLSEVQFGFGEGLRMLFDSLYFSVVTMTTLGFGDITPQADLAKIVTVFECLTGYIMFALAVGLVTRGVVSERDES